MMPRKTKPQDVWPGTRGEITAHVGKCADVMCQEGATTWLAIVNPGISDYPTVRRTACEALAYRIPQR